jgi:hypothetical protein
LDTTPNLPVGKQKLPEYDWCVYGKYVMDHFCKGDILMTVASQVKQTLAGLKSAQATLRIYAAQSQSAESKDVFADALTATGEITNEIEERLRILEFQEPQYKGL